MAKTRRTLLVLATLSGVFGINYEVLFFRLITAHFGDMLHVQAAILAMFLLGVAVGAVLGDRLRRLWLLEMLVGLTALGIAFLLAQSAHAAWLGPILQSAVATAVICMLLVAVPATLIGCSLPLFSEYVAQYHGGSARDPFREVYASYALGAAVSVLLTEYVLVRTIGTTGTLAILAAGNLAIGLALFLWLPDLRGGGVRPARVMPNRGPWLTRPFVALLTLGCASAVFQMVFVRAAMEILGNAARCSR